jgi:Skp family chaperone for outer membrane proteins
MKKLTFVLIAVLGSTLFAEAKYAVVDMLVLVRNHASYDTNKELLVSTEKNCNKRVDAFKKELEKVQQEGKKLSEEYRNPMLSSAAKKKIEDSLQSIQQEYFTVQQRLRNEMLNAQRELQDLEQVILKKQTDDIRAKVSELAKKEGYSLVLDLNSAVYFDKECNLTDKVLELMGVDPKKAKNPRESETNESN